MFIGWKTESHFIQQMWSSLKESWFSTPRKCVKCFTWNSLWTRIQMFVCLAEVHVSLVLESNFYFFTIFEKFDLTFCSPSRHEQRERPGSDSQSVHNICKACFWGVLFACEYNRYWLCTVVVFSNFCILKLFCFVFQTKKYADVIIPRGVDNMGENLNIETKSFWGDL